MRLKIGVIGIGNAGGQVAALSKKEGFEAIAINVSEDDTKTLEGMTTMVIGNSMGSGKNRDVAKKVGKQSIKDLLQQEEFNQFVNGCQVVYTVNSTGGGTGAALGPMMTAVLKAAYKNADAAKRIRFINVGIIPAITEAIQAQENTLATMKELTSYDSCYTLYDNGHYSEYPVQQMMEKVNTDIVEDMKVIRGDYNLLSKFTQIDPQDMLNIMSFDGMFRIANAVGFQEKDLDKVSIEEMLVKNLGAGAGCEIDRDHIVKCMAPIVNIRKEVSTYFNSALPKVRELVGEPPVEFQHYYVIDEDEEHLKNRVHVIMTGLSTPDDRLKKIVQRIEEVKAALAKKKSSSVLSNYGETTNFVGDAIGDKGEGSNDIADVMDMF